MCSLTSLPGVVIRNAPPNGTLCRRVAEGEFRHPGLIRHPPPPRSEIYLLSKSCTEPYSLVSTFRLVLHTPVAPGVVMITRVRPHINIVQRDLQSSVAHSWSRTPSLTPSRSQSLYNNPFVLSHSIFLSFLSAALLAWR
jgi:hypothetical protein